MKKFSKVCNIFYPPQQPVLRFFNPISNIKKQGRFYCNVQIANKLNLRIYKKVALEVHVTDIINKLNKLMQDQEQFRFK